MKAKFVSVWDDGIEIITDCDYDPETNIASDIESVDVNGLDMLVEEYVILPGDIHMHNIKKDTDEEE